MTEPTIGFIGLGVMGKPVAGNLLKNDARIQQKQIDIARNQLK